MVWKRYPSSGTLTYTGTDTTTNSVGVFTAGTVVTRALILRAEFNNEKFIVDPSGDRIDYTVNFFMPLLTLSTIPLGATIYFEGQEYKIKQIPPTQKYTEIRC